MSGMEIERKFLVLDQSFKREAYAHSHIRQGYICSERGLSRYEFEKEISVDEAKHLFRLCEPGVIEKTRWLVKSGDHTFEVDEFFGDNEGLVMAEVELYSAGEDIIIPAFIGEEVTGDRRYYNSQLRVHPFKEWGVRT